MALSPMGRNASRSSDSSLGKWNPLACCTWSRTSTGGHPDLGRLRMSDQVIRQVAWPLWRLLTKRPEWLNHTPRFFQSCRSGRWSYAWLHGCDDWRSAPTRDLDHSSHTLTSLGPSLDQRIAKDPNFTHPAEVWSLEVGVSTARFHEYGHGMRFPIMGLISELDFRSGALYDRLFSAGRCERYHRTNAGSMRLR